MKPWDILPHMEELLVEAQRAYRHSELRKLRLWLKGKTLHWALYLVLASVLAGGTLGLHDYLRSFVYVVCVDNLEVGLVREPEELAHFLDDLTEQCGYLYGVPVEPEQAITLRWEYRPDDEADAAAVKEALRRQITLVTEAVMITVDGKRVVPVVSQEEVVTVIELLSKAYVKEADNIKLLEVDLVEEVAGEFCRVPPVDVRSAEEVAALLMDSGRYREQFQVASRGVTPGMDAADDTQQALETPVVNVLTKEELTVIESIPFSTRYTYTSNLWYVQSRVTEAGKAGSKQVVYIVTRENGQEVSRQKLSEQVLQAPTTRVIERGTARVPSMGSGQFLWPVGGSGGRLTQGFHSRHTGIDIGAPTGTPVLAADRGVVMEVGWHYRMGNHIVLYHGAYWTVYMHHSRNLVTQGSTVSRGQKIAEVGNTGNSYGSHLHFEIRRDNGSGGQGSVFFHTPLDALGFFSLR